MGANGDWSGGLIFDGDISEIIIFNRALTSYERQRVEQYLSEKYAIEVTRGPENIPVQVGCVGAGVETGYGRFLIAQYGRITMTWVDHGVIRQRYDPGDNRLHQRSKIGGHLGVAGASGEDGVSRKQVFTRMQANAAGRMTRSMQYPDAAGRRQLVAVLDGYIHRGRLRFKQVKPNAPVYSVRIGLNHRALGLLKDDTITWFWIGSHDEYDRLLR